MHQNEKQNVAVVSVLAAIFLTSIKFVVAILTGSLGILSEAAHSSLDLCAAIITLIAVKLSDKPADSTHNYGHGKVESFSALIEVILLLITCGWIAYEAIGRLFLNKAVEIDNTIWGILVVAVCVIVDISRSRALKRVADKYNSPALQADALHFLSDVWSSIVVMLGLICIEVGKLLHIEILKYGDPIAALGVSVLVIAVSIRLVKQTVNVLLDAAPAGAINTIVDQVKSIDGVLELSNVRVRLSGPKYFIDLNVGISVNQTHKTVHDIVDNIQTKLHEIYPTSDIMISTFPVKTTHSKDEQLETIVKSVVDKFELCTNIHNINIYEVSGKKHLAIHIEVKRSIDLNESHKLSHDIENEICQVVENVDDINVFLEYVEQKYLSAEDITSNSEELVQRITSLLNVSPDNLNCHHVKIYRRNNKYTIFLHCALNNNVPIEKAQIISKKISGKIRKNINSVESIHVHIEPMNKT